MAVGSDDNDLNEALAEFQRCARDMLKAQQETFLAAVKTWREGVGKAPAWPEGGLHRPDSEARRACRGVVRIRRQVAR